MYEDTQVVPAPVPRRPESNLDDFASLDTTIMPTITGYRDPLAGSGVRELPLRTFDIRLAPSESLIGVTVPHRVAAGGATTAALVRATGSMIAREGLLRVVILCANVLLARLLAPQDFGIYTVLAFFNTFLVTFSTFGLAAAIVQRERAPSRGELAALTTVQLVAAVCLALVAELSAPFLLLPYNLGPDGVWLVRAMAFGFVLVSASATPMALLERRLAFGRVALVEVTSGVTYQVLAVVLAYNGFGVWSLVIGTLAGAAVTLLLAYLAAGWRPRLSLRWGAVASLIRFGVRYQAVNVLALVKDAATPLFVAIMLGPAAVGYIDWATTIAFYPLILVAIIARVTFPVYARLAGDRAGLQRMIEATIRAQAYVIYPAVAVLAALAPFITVVVFTAKWLPAVPLIYLLLVTTMAASVSSALVAALNALGKPQIVLRLTFMWLVLDWATTVAFVLWFNMLGYAIADAVVATSVIVVVVVFRRYQPVRVVRNVARPIVCAGLAGGGLFALSLFEPPDTLALLLGEAAAGFAAFVVLELVVDGRFRRDVLALLRLAFARSPGAVRAAAR
jgi:O-antigen/teichoic acid export membrane protein